jgi:hypothetical protein
MTSRIDQFKAVLRKDENLTNDLTTDQIHHVAVLLAFSGCTPPLPVWTTREELAIAPSGTILEDSEYQVIDRGPFGTWYATGDDRPLTTDQITLPVRVRYLP